MEKEDLADLVTGILNDYGYDVDGECIWAIVDEIADKIDINPGGDEYSDD